MRTLIVGPEKSGTTALLYMLANASTNAHIIMEKPASTLRDLPQDCIVKLVFEQESDEALLAAASQFDRRILLVRDPRDNLLNRLLCSISDQPERLADDEFIGTLLTQLRAKQRDPQAHDLLAIASLFESRAGEIVDRTVACAARYANFIACNQNDWLVLYYEDLIDGNLRGLKRYLGLSSLAPAELPQAVGHLALSKRSGDWRHWFNANDVTVLQPALDRLLPAFGYEDEWQLAAHATISPEHAGDFLFNLIQTRRKFYGMTPFGSGGTRTPRSPRCNICGSEEFGYGPNGRTSDNGALPHCSGCGSLERQRIVRSLLQAMPLGFIDWRRGLQFSPDPGVCAEQFRAYEVSVYGGENSVDIQAIDRADGSYDFISLNHVLEFVPDDLRGFDELIRVMSARGILQACFSTPLSRAASVDYSVPFGPHEAWHLYGLDLAERFQCAQKKLSLLVVEAPDPCTGSLETVHFFLKNVDDVERMRTWIGMSCPAARIIG